MFEGNGTRLADDPVGGALPLLIERPVHQGPDGMLLRIPGRPPVALTSEDRTAAVVQPGLAGGQPVHPAGSAVAAGAPPRERRDRLVEHRQHRPDGVAAARAAAGGAHPLGGAHARGGAVAVDDARRADPDRHASRGAGLPAAAAGGATRVGRAAGRACALGAGGADLAGPAAAAPLRAGRRHRRLQDRAPWGAGAAGCGRHPDRAPGRVADRGDRDRLRADADGRAAPPRRGGGGLVRRPARARGRPPPGPSFRPPCRSTCCAR